MSLMGKLQMLEFTLPSCEVWSANWEVPRERILTLFVKGTKARCAPSEWRASSRIDWYKQRNSKRYKCWMPRSTDEGRGNQRKADAYNCIKYTQFHRTHSKHHTAHNTDASVAVADHIFHLFRLCLLFFFAPFILPLADNSMCAFKNGGKKRWMWTRSSLVRCRWKDDRDELNALFSLHFFITLV